MGIPWLTLAGVLVHPAPPPIERVTFQLNVVSNGKADFLGLPGAQNVPKTEIASHFIGNLMLVGRPAARIWVGRFDSTKITFESGSARMPAVETGLTYELQKPFLVAFGLDGQIESLRFSPELAQMSVRLISSLLGYLQAPTSNNVKARDEETSSGVFRFAYRNAKHIGGVTRISKQSVHPLTNPTLAGQPTSSLSGTLALSVDGAVFGLPVKEVSGSLIEATTWRGHEISTTRLQVLLKRYDVCSLPDSQPTFEALKSQLTTFKIHRVFEQPDPAEIERNLQANELGAESTSDVLARLSALGTSVEAGQDLTSLYLKVNALLYERPESAQALKPIFLASPVESAVFQIATRALGAIGNDSCQDLLVDALAAKQNDSGWTTRLLATLTRLKHPNRQTQLYVEKLSVEQDSSPGSRMAVMVLGAFSRALASVEPGRAAVISDELLARLERAKDVGDQELLLGALGNVGSTQTMKGCTEFIASDNPLLRAEATASLRFVKLAVAEELLLHILATDPEPQVRTQAVYALSCRPMGKKVVAALVASLSDKERSVRAPVLELLWPNHATYPTILPAVRKAAETDPDKDIRAEAHKFLAAPLAS